MSGRLRSRFPTTRLYARKRFWNSFIYLFVSLIGETFPGQGSSYSAVSGQSPDTALGAAPLSFGGEWKSTENRPISERGHTHFTFIILQAEDVSKNVHHSPLWRCSLLAKIQRGPGGYTNCLQKGSGWLASSKKKKLLKIIIGHIYFFSIHS